MSLKDYYRILEVPTDASTDDIKKAFRKLAHRFHPDKNPDNHFAEARFREIHEAYQTLHEPRLRKRYDEERFFAGFSRKQEPLMVNAAWLLQQSERLMNHMQQVDSDRMNHEALRACCLFLLEDAHIAILQQEQDTKVPSQFVQYLLSAIDKLDYRLVMSVTNRLRAVTASDGKGVTDIDSFLQRRRREYQLSKAMPLLVIAIAMLACFLMFLFARK